MNRSEIDDLIREIAKSDYRPSIAEELIVCIFIMVLPGLLIGKDSGNSDREISRKSQVSGIDKSVKYDQVAKCAL